MPSFFGDGGSIQHLAMFFAVGQPTGFAQIVQQPGHWVMVLNHDVFTVQLKGDCHLLKPVALLAFPPVPDLRCDVEGWRAFFYAC